MKAKRREGGNFFDLKLLNRFFFQNRNHKLYEQIEKKDRKNWNLKKNRIKHQHQARIRLIKLCLLWNLFLFPLLLFTIFAWKISIPSKSNQKKKNRERETKLSKNQTNKNIQANWGKVLFVDKFHQTTRAISVVIIYGYQERS